MAAVQCDGVQLECGMTLDHVHSLWLTDAGVAGYEQWGEWLLQTLCGMSQLRRLTVAHCLLRAADYRVLLSAPRLEYVNIDSLWVDQWENRSASEVRLGLSLSGWKASSSLRTLTIEHRHPLPRSGLPDFLTALQRPAPSTEAPRSGLELILLRATFDVATQLDPLIAIHSLTAISLSGCRFQNPAFLDRFVSAADGTPLLSHLSQFEAIEVSYTEDEELYDARLARRSTGRFLDAYRQLSLCRLSPANVCDDVVLAAMSLPRVGVLELHGDLLDSQMQASKSDSASSRWLWPAAATSAPPAPPAFIFPSLCCLTLYRLPLRDDDLPVLLRASPQLRHLALRRCLSLTVAAWLLLADAGNNLVVLELTWVTMDLTDSGWRQESQRYPHLSPSCQLQIQPSALR